MKRSISNRTKRATPKRSAAQREYDLTELAGLYLQGKTQQQIAEHFSTNRPYSLSTYAIGHDIQILHQRWIETQLLNMDEAKARELSRIDKLEMAYWDGWDRSLKTQETFEAEKVEDTQPGAKGTTQKFIKERSHKKEVTMVGEPRFLDGVARCIEQRCRILGIHEPQKIEVDWRQQAIQSGLDPAKIYDDLVTKFIDAKSKS